MIFVEGIGKARRMGGSLGIIIPKEVVEAENIKENDPVKFNMQKITDSSDIFGKFKTGQSAQKSKDDIRKELWGIE